MMNTYPCTLPAAHFWKMKYLITICNQRKPRRKIQSNSETKHKQNKLTVTTCQSQSNVKINELNSYVQKYEIKCVTI